MICACMHIQVPRYFAVAIAYGEALLLCRLRTCTALLSAANGPSSGLTTGDSIITLQHLLQHPPLLLPSCPAVISPALHEIIP